MAQCRRVAAAGHPPGALYLDAAAGSMSLALATADSSFPHKKTNAIACCLLEAAVRLFLMLQTRSERDQ